MGRYDDAPCSAVAVLCHGQGATDHMLLWQAMLAMQQRGISWLDLGDFNDETAGLQRFKAGLGGRELRLAGMFC